jgi:hypothetical protein
MASEDLFGFSRKRILPLLITKLTLRQKNLAFLKPTAKQDLITIPKPGPNLELVDLFNPELVDSIKEISVNPVWI